MSWIHLKAFSRTVSHLNSLISNRGKNLTFICTDEGLVLSQVGSFVSLITNVHFPHYRLWGFRNNIVLEEIWFPLSLGCLVLETSQFCVNGFFFLVSCLLDFRSCQWFFKNTVLQGKEGIELTLLPPGPSPSISNSWKFGLTCIWNQVWWEDTDFRISQTWTSILMKLLTSCSIWISHNPSKL